MMPCWSELGARVDLGKVDGRLIVAAGSAAGWTVDLLVSGEVRLLEPGDNIYRGSVVIRADGSLAFKARRPVTWGGVVYDVANSEPARLAFAMAVKRSVAAQAVKVAANKAGWSVQSAGNGRADLTRGGV